MMTLAFLSTLHSTQFIKAFELWNEMIAVGFGLILVVYSLFRTSFSMLEFVHVELVQYCGTSIALAMEIPQYCTKPSTWIVLLN